ncbi:uncharacterized protein BT62DRAFT_730563 [Guyanagaster necrorhizus]|uniref:Uncharacterized protein n=1 Tax=Guyanagaster necrorhizus TaxID=856835 RepID=A0A9P7VYL6_9AGAR|nr:uncharacterized protein BT62DRAFT_730563 [Guyanagaster necrorhizus MCA 3950]KAG7448845.1 hypothetical protein BT62DRAFT_730563 [Guyanagaster necrorhizus MCA 3950]
MEGRLVLSLIALLALFLVALAVEPTAYRSLFFFPTATLALYIVFFTTTSNALLDSSIGGWSTTIVLYASDYLVLTTDVQRELRKCDQQAGRISKKSFLARLKWAAALCFSLGWAQPAAVLPPCTRQSVTQLWLKVGLCLLLLDAGSALNGLNPAFVNRESITLYGVKRRFLSLLGFGTGTVSVLNIQHCLLFLVTGERVTSALFGRLADGYTVQRFWGTFFVVPMLSSSFYVILERPGINAYEKCAETGFFVSSADFPLAVVLIVACALLSISCASSETRKLCSLFRTASYCLFYIRLLASAPGMFGHPSVGVW